MRSLVLKNLSKLVMQLLWNVCEQLRMHTDSSLRSPKQIEQQPVTSPRATASISTPTHSSSVSGFSLGSANPLISAKVLGRVMLAGNAAVFPLSDTLLHAEHFVVCGAFINEH